MIPTGYICMARIYKFGKWTFEYGHGGCWPLKKNGDPRARAGKKFYADLAEFFTLSDKYKEAYRIGGGCVRF